MKFVKYEQEPFGNSGLLSTFPKKDLLSTIKHSIIDVETRTLTKILDECGAPKFIEYLDIDVEGHEIPVIRSIDFETYKFGAIGVECRYKTPKYNRIEKLLEAAGYLISCNIGSDCFFLPNSRFERVRK